MLTMKIFVRVLIIWMSFLIAGVSLAGQGYIEKNGTKMPIKSSFAVLDKSGGKLTIYMFPTSLSSAEKSKIIKGNAFFTLSGKLSPNKRKWHWYPYAKLELHNKQGKFKSKNDLRNYYLMAYGLNQKNHTDNLNGSFSESDVLGNYSFSDNRVKIKFSGKSEFFKIKWQLNLNVRIKK